MVTEIPEVYSRFDECLAIYKADDEFDSLLVCNISFFSALNYRGESFSYFWEKFPLITFN